MDIITIDGLSGTGKTARAKALAQYLNYNFFSIGYIFRVIAYLTIYDNISNLSKIDFKSCPDLNLPHPFYILLDKINITDCLHGDSKIDEFCITYGSDKNILENVKRIMYSIVAQGNWVIEGRSAASFFPDARIKFLLICSNEERKKRVLGEMIKKGLDRHSAEAIWKISNRRNYVDTYLSLSPMRCYIDSIIIDSTYLEPDQTLYHMIEYCKTDFQKRNIKSRVNIDPNIQVEFDLKSVAKLLGYSNNVFDGLNPIWGEYKSILFYIQKRGKLKNIHTLLEEHLSYHSKINNACVIDENYIKKRGDIYIVSNLHQHLNVVLKGNVISLRGSSLKTIDGNIKSQLPEEQKYRRIITCRFYDTFAQTISDNSDFLNKICKWAIENYAPNDCEVIDMSFVAVEQAVITIQDIFYARFKKSLFFVLVASNSLFMWNMIIQTLFFNIPIICVDKKIWGISNHNF